MATDTPQDSGVSAPMPSETLDRGAVDLAAKLEALIDARIRQAGGGNAPE